MISYLNCPLAFPVGVAASTEEAEPALATIMPINKARATPKTLDTVLAIGLRGSTYALTFYVSNIKSEDIFFFTL